MLRGEWWIDEDGQVLFADGDVGGMNHEMYVIDGLTRAILDAVGGIPYNEEYAGPMLLHDKAVRQALGVSPDAPDEALRIALDKAVEPVWPDETQRAAALDAAFAITDAREYAIRYDGWKRLKGTNVETWTLTKDDLDAIVTGIDEAAGDSDALPSTTAFFIEVRASGKCFSGVPWDVLQEAQPMKLRAYQMF